MEAIADPDTYLWYIHFENRDCSTIKFTGEEFHCWGSAKVREYNTNGRMQDWLYFLANGIYPGWDIFCKTHSHPLMEKEKKYAAYQEGVRKDVKRSFGVLVSWFHVL
mmetsp:Transcript_29859/g.45728  ORF Transcript_29859/g.45728 Transcript_29859/m.45728 type:complete len:107 (+) Transcript_29859:581-901(+)